MGIRLNIYKHKRLIVIFFTILFAGIILFAQNIFFNSVVIKTVYLSSETDTKYLFDSLQEKKQETNITPIKKTKIVKSKSKTLPDLIIKIGNNIKFIGYIKSSKKIFMLVEYNGIEYNLKKNQRLGEDGSDKIIFKDIKGDYAFFEINKYIYQMSIKQKNVEIPFLAE